MNNILRKYDQNESEKSIGLIKESRLFRIAYSQMWLSQEGKAVPVLRTNRAQTEDIYALERLTREFE